MSLHKFVIGQAVDFDGKLPSMSRPKGPFEIVSVLSVDDANSPTYRIESQTEIFWRASKKPTSSQSICRRANKRLPRCGPIPCLDDGCPGRSGRGDDLDKYSVLLERSSPAFASPAERQAECEPPCNAASAGGGYWVSSNRAVTVTVSLVLARLDRRRGRSAGGKGARKCDGHFAPGFFREDHQPAYFRASRADVDLGLPPGVGDGKRARLVEQRARIVENRSDAVD